MIPARPYPFCLMHCLSLNGLQKPCCFLLRCRLPKWCLFDGFVAPMGAVQQWRALAMVFLLRRLRWNLHHVKHWVEKAILCMVCRQRCSRSGFRFFSGGKPQEQASPNILHGNEKWSNWWQTPSASCDCVKTGAINIDAMTMQGAVTSCPAMSPLLLVLFVIRGKMKYLLWSLMWELAGRRLDNLLSQLLFL